MAEITVGKGIGARFQPDNNGVQLTEGANAGVMDPVIDDGRGHQEIQSSINAVSKGNEAPRAAELVACRLHVCRRLSFLDPCDGTLGLLSCGKLDDVCDEEMAWDQEVEDGAVDDVLAAIVVAADAYQDSVLSRSAEKGGGEA